MVKLLVIIYNKEKLLKLLFKRYNLTYQVMTYAEGTASNSLLAYFGLNKSRKNVYFSLISKDIEDNILNDLKIWCNIDKIGYGIAFTISLTSSNKFIKDNLGDGEEKNMNKSNYELVISIVSAGYSDMVMRAALKEGCSGGTVIKGRSVGSRGTIFMDISLEPEKDMVLNIVKSDIKKKVMERITKECGVKTDAHGVVISLPLDNVTGLQE